MTKNKTQSKIKSKTQSKIQSKTKSKTRIKTLKKENKSNYNFVEAFTNVYEKNIWGDNNDPNYEGSSGTGSDIKYNSKTYVPFLKHFIKKYNIKNVVDLGSGDFRVGLLIYDKMNINYTGYDAYKKLVDYNNKKYEGYGMYKFIHSDFRKIGEREKIIPADLYILKDVLQHWSTSDIIEFLDYLIKSKKCKYILICNSIDFNPENNATHRTDIKPGQYSSLSSKTYPLNKYNMEVLYTWDIKEVSLITNKNFIIKKEISKTKILDDNEQNLINNNLNYKKYFDARLIINNKNSDFYKDFILIKNILEEMGGKIELVYYDLLNNKEEYINTKTNIQIFFEHTFVINANNIFPSDNSFIFINFENIVDWDLLNIKSKKIIPLCKTHFMLNKLKKLHINTGIYLGFGNKYNISNDNISNDNINKYENIKKIANLCFHNAVNCLKGTIELINVWLYNNINQPLIIIANNYNNYNDKLFIYWNTLYNTVYNKIKNKNTLPIEIINICPKNIILPNFENIGSIYFLKYEKNKIDENLIYFLQIISDIHICPSIYEDWSQTIDDARLTKSLVITLDVEPLNILIDNTCGVLINTINKNETNKTTLIQNILPYNLIKYYPSEIQINSNKFTSTELFKSIKLAFNIIFDDKRNMAQIAFHKSQIDYFYFYKNITKLILNKIYNKINIENNNFKCSNDLKIINITRNLNKITYNHNNKYINPILLNKKEKIIIISEFIPDDNYLGTFVTEIFNIWLYTESYLPNKHKLSINNDDFILVLKNYKNDQVNILRLNLFQQLYKNVYINSYDNLDNNYTYKIINLENGSRFLHFKTLVTYYWWISNRPGYNPYLKSLIYNAKKSLNTHNIVGSKIGYFYRKSSRFVYDINDKDKLNKDINKSFLHNILKDKLGDLSVYFEGYDIENKNINDIANFVKDKQILISPHWHDLTHLILLPDNATIIEITYSKHWYCDGVCKDHLSGKIPYDEDCHNRVSTYFNGTNYVVNPGFNLSNSELYYHKADYHNLALVCCKNWIEFQLDYGKDYVLDKGNYNPVYINELYVNTNKLINVIKDNFKIL
jgi:hypothetical protein